MSNFIHGAIDTWAIWATIFGLPLLALLLERTARRYKNARRAKVSEARDLHNLRTLLHIADDEYASESGRQQARAAIAKQRMATSPANLRVVPYVREAQVEAGLERLLAEIDGDQGGAA